ncbi:MAG: HEPN domain-containing protein [Alphaproteobacteria bacterium]|nr:HEPN domain-containing protein [Alphaproteobacteria bacterium]
MILTKGIIKADIIAAKQAIEYFEANGNRNIKNVAAYHLQQAAEKLIKIQIYANCSNINNSQLYTHNLERLILYADSSGVELIIPDYIREHSLQITDWESGSRYDVGFSVRIDTLKKTYEVLSKWAKII